MAELNTESEPTKEVTRFIPKSFLSGKWRLTYVPKNSQGSLAFGAYLLTEYKHPVTKKRRFLFDVNGTKLLGYNVGKIDTIFNPDEEPDHAIIIDWLICHPEVAVPGLDEDILSKIKKDSNPQLTLINLDFQEIEDIEENDVIDILVGRLSQLGGNKAISQEKVQWLLATNGLAYRDARYIRNKESHRKIVRNMLKTWVRKSVKNAKLVTEQLDYIDSLKINYEVQEMLRTQIITNESGINKYNRIPLGSTKQSIVNYFQENPDIYEEAINNLLQKVAKE